MSYVVTLVDFAPGSRSDGTPWTQVQIQEAPDIQSPFTTLETRALTPLDSDPANPQGRDVTTTLATLAQGWYRLVWLDAAGHSQTSEAVFSSSVSGAYSSVLAVRRALSPNADPNDTSTAASLSSDELSDAIAEASAEVDSRLAARYAIPLTSPYPPIVESLTRDIAAYLATLTFRRGDPVDPNDPVQLRYNRAQALLQSLQDGKIELTNAVAELQAPEADVENAYDGALFTADDFGLGYGRVWPSMPFTYGDTFQ